MAKTKYAIALAAKRHASDAKHHTALHRSFFMACTHTTYGPKPASRDYIG
ncbi:MAG: hypothetical protein PUB53_00760 [Bacteroidales bacterium]|nr:hypothetical protein [Bacteroidales bacterium]